MTNRFRTFLSVGSTKNPAHIEFVRELTRMLEDDGIEVLKMANGYESPLDRVIAEMKNCDGAIIVCFERIFAKTATEYRKTPDQPNAIAPLVTPTVWNHVEAAIARSLGKPVLILAEQGCRRDGMLDPIVQFSVTWMEMDSAELSRPHYRQLLAGWRMKLESLGTVKKEEPLDPTELTLRDMAKIPVRYWISLAAILITAFAAVFQAGNWFGAHFPPSP